MTQSESTTPPSPTTHLVEQVQSGKALPDRWADSLPEGPPHPGDGWLHQHSIDGLFYQYLESRFRSRESFEPAGSVFPSPSPNDIHDLTRSPWRRPPCLKSSCFATRQMAHYVPPLNQTVGIWFIIFRSISFQFEKHGRVQNSLRIRGSPLRITA